MSDSQVGQTFCNNNDTLGASPAEACLLLAIVIIWTSDRWLPPIINACSWLGHSSGTLLFKRDIQQVKK